MKNKEKYWIKIKVSDLLRLMEIEAPKGIDDAHANKFRQMIAHGEIRNLKGCDEKKEKMLKDVFTNKIKKGKKK